VVVTEVGVSFFFTFFFLHTFFYTFLIDSVNEIFCPKILEIHSEIESLSEDFDQLRLEYQTDNEREFEINYYNLKEPSSISNSDISSDSSDELDELEQYDDNILTAVQIEKF